MIQELLMLVTPGKKLGRTMHNQKEQMEKAIIPHIEWMADELGRLDWLEGKVMQGCWANQDNILAYVSYSPGDPSHENIDATIHLKLQENSIFLEAGICLSDGTILAEIANQRIELSSGENVIEQIGRFSQTASRSLLIRLEQVLGVDSDG